MSIRDSRRGTGGKRALIQVTLHVGGATKRYRGQCGEISKSGIFVELAERIPEGRRVDLVLSGAALERIGMTTIATSGIVVHQLKGFGVGVRFSRQPDRTRQKLETLLEKINHAKA